MANLKNLAVFKSMGLWHIIRMRTPVPLENRIERVDVDSSEIQVRHFCTKVRSRSMSGGRRLSRTLSQLYDTLAYSKVSTCDDPNAVSQLVFVLRTASNYHKTY